MMIGRMSLINLSDDVRHTACTMLTERPPGGRYQRRSYHAWEYEPQIAGGAAEQWQELVQKYKARGMSNSDAVKRANKERPDLREAFVAEHNTANRRHYQPKRKS